MATASIRKLIVEAIVTQLKLITIANGYNTALASNVVEWQTTNVAIDTLPSVEVKDSSEEAEIKGTLSYRTLNIELVGRIASADIDDARNLLTDITVAMKAGPTYPVNVYLSTLIEIPDLIPEQQSQKAIKFTVTYELKYRI
jgi:hypothetical protein